MVNKFPGYLSSDCGVVMQALEAKMLQIMINRLHYGEWIECWPLHDAVYIPLFEQRWRPRGEDDTEYQQMDANYHSASYVMEESFEAVLERYPVSKLKADLVRVHKAEPHLSSDQ